HADLYRAHTLEWRRKKDINEVLPGIPIAQVREICRRVAEHNQEVRRLTKLWELLIRTLQGDFDRSPWLQYRPDEPIPISTTAAEPAVRMAWRECIHYTWQAPTTVMDATLPVQIVQQFFPAMPQPSQVSAPAPHARVRQAIDTFMP